MRFALADFCDIKRIGTVVRGHQLANLRRIADADLDVLHSFLIGGVAQGEFHIELFAGIDLIRADGVGIQDHLRLGDGFCAVRIGGLLIALNDVHINADRHALARVGGIPILQPGNCEIYLFDARGDHFVELEAAVAELDDRAAVQASRKALCVVERGDFKREGIQACGKHRRNGNV